MAKVTGREWRDEQDASNYPFEDGLPLVNNDGLPVPPGLLLDAVIYAPFTGDRPRLSKIIIANDTAELVIGDSVDDAVCAGSLDLAQPPDAVVLRDAWGRDCGLLISSALRLASLQALPVGEHAFESHQTAFVTSVSHLTPPNCVQELVLPSGERLTGEVWLVGGAGVILEVANNTVRVNCVGDPLFRKSQCNPETYSTPRFLRQVVVQKGPLTQVILPNSLGDVPITVGSNIVDDTVLRVEQVSDGLRFGVVGEKLRGVL